LGQRGFVAVTGAFGFTGQYIARRLLARGERVRNLTNSPQRPSPLQGRVETWPLAFDQPRRLVEALRGVRVLINTYWVRYNRAGFHHDVAVDNTLRLFEAARRAQVQRIVHVSITNPSEQSPLTYFAGKAQLERALREEGPDHTILRPAVLYGRESILINNIAWLLRKVPVFLVFGDGAYRLQPIHVEDFAGCAMRGVDAKGNEVIDAVGPETFTFRQLVALIGQAIGRPRPIISAPPSVPLAVAFLAGKLLGDVLITRDEVTGLMAGLLCTDAPPAGPTRFSEWAAAHGDELGRRYAHEISRRRDRTAAIATAPAPGTSGEVRGNVGGGQNSSS